MQAVILIGGLGTRLRALFPDRPKCLVPVLGRPYLDRLLDWLARFRISDIHLACGYRAGDVARWLEHRSDVTMSTEPEPLGTGGGLKFVESFVRGERFLVFNGDSFLPHLDLSAMLHSDDPALTIAVTRIESPGRYGTVEFDAEGRITAFLEKAERPSGWVNGGVYLMHRSIFEQIEAGRSVSLETEVFPKLCAAGQVRAFTAPPPLLDIGTPDGLAATEQFFQSLEKP